MRTFFGLVLLFAVAAAAPMPLATVSATPAPASHLSAPESTTTLRLHKFGQGDWP